MVLMNPEDFRTVAREKDPDGYNRLSDFLNVLGNSSRLKILKSIENHPKDAKEISREIDTSYENTKKHLAKLEKTGIIKKEPGFGRQTSKGIHAVWKYSPVPGSIELLVRNLGTFCNMNVDNPGLLEKAEEIISALKEDKSDDMPLLIVLGGDDDGRVYIPKTETVFIGRSETPTPDSVIHADRIEINENFLAVTRISKPHAKLFRENSTWYIEDCKSTGGTYVGNRELTPGIKYELRNGDLIDLGRGDGNVTLLFHSTRSQESRENI
jgi:DNA-binding transcriptional ArsR family regulator